MQTLRHSLPTGNFPSWAELPHLIRERLAREGVATPDAWRRLGRKRLQLFGVTRTMVEQLDILARGAP